MFLVDRRTRASERGGKSDGAGDPKVITDSGGHDMTLWDVDEWYALGFNLLEGVVIGNERIPTLAPAAAP